MAEVKTNAMRLLEKAGIAYRVHSYEAGDGHIDGVSVAQKVGKEPSAVFKTLVTRGASGGHFVFVVPVNHELDLKRCARAAGEKSVEMIAVQDITKVTGYIRGGCSPVGMKKQYRTAIDESALEQETILVSAGKIGWQVEVRPRELAKLISGNFAALCQR